jgi:hypothetical protein
MITYEIEIVPKEAVLGQPILAKLKCVNGKQPADNVVTFSHASLTLNLQPGEANEPLYLFPNRRVIHDGSILIREATSGGLERLEPDETRSRNFELTSLFPHQLFDVEQFKFSYTLYDGKVEHGPAPPPFRVVFAPLSGEHLLERLLDPDLEVRRCSADLLRRLSGLNLEYDPAAPDVFRQAVVAEWTDLWRRRGSPLKWQAQKR